MDQTQIFGHQSRSETTFITVRSGSSVLHARDWVVYGARPVGARAGVDDVGECFGVKTQAHAEIHRLRSADHANGQQHIVADFSSLPRAHRSAMNDIGAHASEDLLGSGELFLRSADHERELSRFGFHHTARNRRIHVNGAPRKTASAYLKQFCSLSNLYT